jgi:cytosine/adenosine deaminase-related metal-dependent hydrolase
MTLRLAGTALLLFAAATASAADKVEKSKILMMGNQAGWSETTYSDDGTVRNHYEYNDRGRGPKLDSVYKVGADGIPTSVEIRGNDYMKGKVDETYARNGDEATWKNSAESEKRTVAGPTFYLSLDGPPEEYTLLMRALLKAPNQTLKLLPDGEARIEKLATIKAKGKAGTKNATLYALHGLSLTPSYAWLDDEQRFFAGYSSWSSTVREGYEDALPAIGKRQEAEEQRLAQARAKSLTTKLDKPLAIVNARVFDPVAATVVDGATVVVDKGRILAVGKNAAVPAGAETLDAQNQFLMPGLWDMHVHFSSEADGVLDIASGVTSVRDLANNPEKLAARIKAIEDGTDIGPRIVKAGIIDGPGPFAGPTKALAATEAEAQKIVDEYAATGYEQIKIYSSIKPELMPAIARMAHAKGLRVSGHVPAFMTARQFVENGADEIQHINMLMLNFLFDKVQDTRSPARFVAIGEYGASIDLSSREVRDFVDLLKRKDIVIDPTVCTFEDMFLGRPGLPGPGYDAIIDRLPVTWQRGVRSGAGGLPIKPGQEALYRKGYQKMIDFVGLLYRSGVRIVPGTDGMAGVTLPRELELYVAAGIAPKDVLRLATYESAKVVKRDDRLGRVEPGYVADLILIDGDPTLNIGDVRKVRTVIRGDRRYDSAALYKAVQIKPWP